MFLWYFGSHIYNRRFRCGGFTCGTTEKDKYVDLWRGTGDDIKFPLVPYAKYEIEHTSISDNTLVIVLDSSVNFAEINSETVGKTAYIGTQLETDVIMDKYDNLLNYNNYQVF